MANKPLVSITFPDLPDTYTIPQKTSDLTNDSGFVNASGAAAAAPVQSVNGQTGAVTVSGLSQEAKQALMDCFANTAWAVNNGQTYYDALASALGLRVLSSITAVFTQGSATIYDTDSLDTLKQYLVVTANYSDTTTATVTDYTLSGALIEGTSTITVSYGGKTDTFNVTVSSSYAFLGGYSIAPRSGSIDVKIFKDTNNARCGCVYATGTHPYPKDSSASTLAGDWYPVPIPQGATSMIVTMPSALYVGVRIFAWNASQSYYDNTNGFSSSWTASNASTFDVSSYNDGSWFAGFTFKVGQAGKTDMRNYDMSGVSISFE